MYVETVFYSIPKRIKIIARVKIWIVSVNTERVVDAVVNRWVVWTFIPIHRIVMASLVQVVIYAVPITMKKHHNPIRNVSIDWLVIV